MKRCIALLCFPLAVASCQATVTFSTFGPDDSALSFGYGFGDILDTRIANQFTSSHTGSLDFIKLRTQASAGNGIISLYRDSGDDIGGLMAQFTVDLTTAGVKTLTNTDPSIQLVSGEKYWIECSSAIGSGVYSGWLRNNQSINGRIKFGQINASPSSTYTAGSGALSAFSVNVTPVPEPFTLAAMGMFSALIARRRLKAR